MQGVEGVLKLLRREIQIICVLACIQFYVQEVISPEMRSRRLWVKT